MSTSCYEKDYDRLEGLSNSISGSETDEQDSKGSKPCVESDLESASSRSNFDMPPPPNRIISPKEKNMGAHKKRNAKNQHKVSKELIESFISSKTDLTSRSAEAYRQVWEDFIKFSSSVDPKAVSSFIKWKFKLDYSLKEEEIILEGTSLKYESILAQFFKHIGYKLHRNFKRKFVSRFYPDDFSLNI